MANQPLYGVDLGPTYPYMAYGDRSGAPFMASR